MKQYGFDHQNNNPCCDNAMTNPKRSFMEKAYDVLKSTSIKIWSYGVVEENHSHSTPPSEKRGKKMARDDRVQYYHFPPKCPLSIPVVPKDMFLKQHESIYYNRCMGSVSNVS